MRNAETILGIIRERGRKRLPLGDVYRQLFNPDLFLHSYARLYRNDGAMTKGVTAETVDGMSLGKIDGIIERLRYERYRWTPVRRVHIPKKGGKSQTARAFRLGRTSCCKTWSAPSWRRTTNRGSPTTPTASGRDAGATPRCAGQAGLDRDEVVHRG